MQTYEEYLDSLPEGQQPMSKEEFSSQQSENIEQAEEVERTAEEEAEIRQGFNQAIDKLPNDDKVNLSFSIANKAGLSDYSGGGSKRVLEKDFQKSDYAFNESLKIYDEVISLDYMADVTEDEIKNEAANIYFGIDNILDYETKESKGSKSDQSLAVGRFRRDKLNQINPETIGTRGYPKGRPYTEQEIQAMPEMIELRRRNEKKFANKEEYEAYRKEALGDKYNDFLKWESGNKDIEIPLSAIQAGKDKIFLNKLTVDFRDKFDGPGGELIQKNLEVLTSLNKTSQEQFESTLKTKELIEADKKILSEKESALIKAQQPFVNNINNIQKEIDDLGFSVFDTVGKVEINEDGSIAGGDYVTVDYEDAENKVAEYNSLVEKYKTAYVDYEKQDFEGRYNILIKDQQNLKTTIDKYNNDIQKYAQTGEQARKDFLISKAAGYDYSLTYRAGAAMEDFFIKGGANFAVLTGQTGLKVIKALTNNPALDISIDNSIKNMSESIANYNQRLAEEREEKLPPALTLEDVEFGASGNGVLQYIGEALADNSPSILTTFIPAGAAIAGGARIAGAAGLSAIARKEAAAAAKTYAFYAMRAAQGIFFVGESGGKYGDILVEEYNKKDRIKEIDNLIDKGGLTEVMKQDLIEEKESLNQMLNTNFSFAQKAFSSYGFGATAALAETMGSLKLVSSVGKAAGAYGKIAVKKELYKNAAKFSGVLAKGVIRGLRPAITKAMPTEIFEEAFTQVSHNMIDIVALNEDKSILEGLDADFFVKTAITSFAIMGPTTMNNTRQILQNEFKTKNEIAQNSKDVNELIVIQQQLEGLKGPQRRELNEKRKALVTKLGFYDTQILNKLNSMTTSEIKEVAEIGRQQRLLSNNLTGLVGTGGSVDQNKEYVKTKQSIENQFNNLENRKNELLGRHDQKMLEKMTQLNKERGVSPNLELAYSLGLNNFATNAAFTMSDAGKKFTEISGEDFNNPEAIRKQLKAEGYTDSQIEDVVKKFTGLTPSNGIYLPDTGDIVINQGAIDRTMHQFPAGQANYAALAPLEELFHATISQKGLRVDGELRKDAEQSTQQLLDLIIGKMEVGTPAQKQKLQDLLKRVDKYKKDGVYNYEEMLAQINNAMLMGALNASDFISLPSFKSFLNKAISNIMGDPAWMLELNKPSDVAQFMKNWQNNIIEEKQVLRQTQPEKTDQEGVLESVGELPIATQTYMELDNSILQQALISAIKNNTDQQFPIAQAITEKNWGLISPLLNINSQQEMNAAKEVVIDQLLGRFEGSGQGRYSARNTSLLAGFSLDPDGDAAQVSTYLTKTIRTRKPEIDAAIADRTGRSGQELQQAGGEIVTETETVDTTQLAKKPSETTSLDTETETRITEAVQKVYKGKDLKFSETRNIPKEVADIYGEEFGINPQTITDKTRNFQKTDSDGLTKAKQFLLKNAKDDFARLPKTKDDFGKGTFIPKNVRDALYTDGELTGSLKDYMDLIRTKPEKVIYRDRVGQTIRGLLGLHIRNRMLETAQPSQAKRVQSGARFSEGETFTKKQIDDYNKLARARNKNLVNEIIGTKTEINSKNRNKIQQQLQESIEKYGLNENTFNAAKFNNSGAQRFRLENGDVVYDLTNGETIPGIPNGENKNGVKQFKQPTLKEIQDKHGSGVTLVAARNRLYYGKNDPAYIKALEAAIKNNKKNQPKFKRVTIKNAFTDKGQKDSAINMSILEDTVLELEQAVKNGMPLSIAAIIIEGSYQATTGLIKVAAPFKYRSKIFEYAKYGKASDKTGVKYREEHSPPASVIGASLLLGIKNGNVVNVMSDVKNNYMQIQLSKKDDTKIDKNNLDSMLPENTSVLTPNVGVIRLAASDIDLNSIENPFTNKTLAEDIGLPIKNKADINLESINYQNELIIKGKGKITSLDRNKLKASLPVQNLKSKQAVKNAGDFDIILNDDQRSQKQKDKMLVSLESKGEAIKINKPKKGISVFDFDDTLAKTKEKVIVNMPDGSIDEISASEFARTAGDLQDQGAEFDFSNFENVSSDTQQGPLADLARKRQGKFGSGDIFVLTARPNSAGPAIKQFLESIGINIPLENITGLEDGSPQAKVDWVLNKTAEGYNDFYFADDSLANVKGVKQVLDAVDVKNKVQQALESKGERLNKTFNKQLEQVTGKEAFKKYSDARGRLEGQQKDKGAFKRFIKQFTITPSAEDFMGLMYAFMGKGAQGNAHAKFIKENLMDPYNKAEQELISAQVSVANDFSELKKQFPNLRSKRGKNPLLEEIGVGPYTKSQAIRVYMWNKQGMDIPGMSQRDINALVKAVEADNELNVFADEVILIQKGEQYPAPNQNWLAGDIASDIMQGLKTGFRKKLMAEFNENADIIFSKENLNKIEAIYGSKFREALEDSLRRMRTGSNRPVFVGGGARIVNEMLDWLNSSVGAVMFLNMRSGLLQLISNVNFINWGDNNIYDAAKAFVSKDYFPTVLKLMNSDYLVNRRDGLKINVNEAELTDAGRKGGVKGMINYLLDKGFAITRIMDSVAIATGGATFFINRKKSLQNRVNKETGELYTEAEAEQQAFDDFYAIAEETQQSSNPSKISAQQASFAGRIILSFQNVTMQYNRKTKKSIQDLYNRRTKPGMTQRESDLSNLSSIIYYVGVQNLIFNAMQQALFALAFDDEPDEDEKDKAANIVNGMADSLLFGLGFGGAIISTVKNVLMRIASESEKKTTQYREAVWNVFDISPVLDSKVRKLRTAAKTFDWNMKEIKKRGWSIDNPAYLAVAQIISATTNLPIDRALQKLNNLRQATDEETKTWQRVALALGWSGWNFGLPYWGRQSTIDKEAKNEERLKEKFKIDVRKMKSLGFTKRVPFTGPKSGKPKGKLGVDYVAIERYDGLIQYYKKP